MTCQYNVYQDIKEYVAAIYPLDTNHDLKDAKREIWMIAMISRHLSL
jgi:hypothetical protein